MKIVLVGYGKMNQLVKETINKRDGMECVGIVDPNHFPSLSDLNCDFDVIVDFSHPDNLEMICNYVKKKPVAVVLATTGYTEEQIKSIEQLSKTAPVVYTANFSLGITVMKQVLSQITPILKNQFDVELIEKHHRHKLDAPSGTAIMLLKSMNGLEERGKKYGREGDCRRGDEIGVHSIRGGSITGDHTVMYIGEDEILEITHKAQSKQIFATGALTAAEFAAKQKPGLYDMKDVLFG